MLTCAVFVGGIKICRTLPLDFLCSAGFLDHRAILLAVMGLTKNAGNGICNGLIFSMHLRPAYPLASLAWPLPLALWLNPGCLSPCPLITTADPRVLPGHWEVKLLGQDTLLSLLAVKPRYMVENHAHIFMDEQTLCCLLLIMDDENWLNCSALHKSIGVCHCSHV